ncbi:hypothetical protein BBP40_000619 [Aspergillus hancockii]|nr:hypothetical protein BBP40_000619 [Aspergillus hancockii]
MGKPKGSRNRKTYERLKQQMHGTTVTSRSKGAPVPTMRDDSCTQAPDRAVHPGPSTQLHRPSPEGGIPGLPSLSPECTSWNLDEILVADPEAWLSTDLLDTTGELRLFEQEASDDGHLLITPPEEPPAALPSPVTAPVKDDHSQRPLSATFPGTRESSVFSLPGSTLGSSPSLCGSGSRSPSTEGPSSAICPCSQIICRIELQISLLKQRHTPITFDMLVVTVMPILTKSNKTLSCTACVTEPHIVHLNLLILRRLLHWLDHLSSQAHNKGKGRNNPGGYFSSRLRIGRHEIPSEETSLMYTFLLSQIHTRYRTAIQCLHDRLTRMRACLPAQQITSPSESDELSMDMHYWHGMVQYLERRVTATFETLEAGRA